MSSKKASQINENAAKEKEEKVVSEEEKKSNRFSFIVGIFIAMVIIILFSIFFR
ncbi:MAG TPA: hypothetical protein VF458_13415 [Ktedonobacteraceae bacterium]